MLPLKNNTIISATFDEILQYAPGFVKPHIEKGTEWVHLHPLHEIANKAYGGAGQACVIANLVRAGVVPELFDDTAPLDFALEGVCFEVKTRLFSSKDSKLAGTYTVSESERLKAIEVSKNGGKYYFVLLEQRAIDFCSFNFVGIVDFINIKHWIYPSKDQKSKQPPTVYFYHDFAITKLLGD